MNLSTLITPDRTFIDVEAGSKKRLLETIAHLLHDAEPELGVDALFTSLTARERLGTTGLGSGIAIPHCRLADCSKPTGALLRLANPVDFDAVDNEPVDLLFALVVPSEATQEHLDALATIAAMFNDDGFRQRLRRAGSAADMYRAAIEFHT